MRRFRSSLWLILVAVVALAQTASEKPSLDTRRVGARLSCQCGCKDSVATCSMLECSFSKPAKERIARMQAVGMSDSQIIEAFVRDKHWGCFGSLVIDARSKPHHAPPLEEDPAVSKRVDALAARGGPLHGII